MIILVAVYEKFYSWLCEQPLWLQDAAWRVYNRVKIDDKTIAEYVSVCISEAKREEVQIHKMNKD
ncbi:MAG: hypothetical protein IIV69_08465 [Peptococcaceae bacterium]|nr:hypothetical protein [Peptococcaceae bacterium]